MLESVRSAGIESAESLVTWIVQLLEGRKKKLEIRFGTSKTLCLRASTKVSTKVGGYFHTINTAQNINRNKNDKKQNRKTKEKKKR